MPVLERPREKLKVYGVKNLSNVELLSILLRTGTSKKSVRDLSMDILNKYSMSDFKNLDFQSLKSIKGVGDAKAMTIISAIEFGKRVNSRVNLDFQIKTADDIYYYMKDLLEDLLQEEFWVIFLDNQNMVITKKVIFKGTVNESHVIPRDVFREGVKLNAVKIVLVHNHPSNRVTPSYADIRLTNVFISLGKMLGILVLDHIVIGKDEYYSIREHNKEMFL